MSVHRSIARNKVRLAFASLPERVTHLEKYIALMDKVFQAIEKDHPEYFASLAAEKPAETPKVDPAQLAADLHAVAAKKDGE